MSPVEVGIENKINIFQEPINQQDKMTSSKLQKLQTAEYFGAKSVRVVQLVTGSNVLRHF